MDAHPKSEALFGHSLGHELSEDEPGELTRRLAEQARIFDTALSSITDFAYIFNREGRFIYVNRPLLDLWGLRLEDALGKNFFDLLYPDDLAAKLQRQIQQVIESRQGLTDETPYVSPTGAGGYYEYIFRPVFDADGAVEMVAGSTRDITERKRTEENLRRTQARLESALKAGLAGTFYWDISANRLITDENMMRYFSLSEEAIHEGVMLAEVLPAVYDEDRRQVEQALAEAVEVTGAYSIEYRVNHSDGKMRWLSARGLIERDEAGNAIGLPGFAVDITERKQAEEAIRFQAHLLNTVEQAVIATDLSGTIMYWNEFAETLYGWLPAEAIGRNVIEVVTSEATQEQAAEIMALLKQGHSWSGEFTVRRRDGESFPAMITDTPIYNDEGVMVGIVGVSIDISERKHSEEALRESEERFRAAFEQANVGIMQASFDGILLTVNPGFRKILGYSEEEARGLSIRAITRPEDYEREQERTRQLMTGEIGDYSLEKRYLHKNGKVVWGQMTATLVRQKSGEPFYMLAIIEDITERKRAEEELKQINEQLEARVVERTFELRETLADLQAEISERRRVEGERASILRRLVMAQEEERRRIARDMHDQFGQQLTVLLLKLGILKEDCGAQTELSEQVENLEAVARKLDADVDFLVWELRPTVLDDLGLQAALTNYAQNWSQHFGIQVEAHTRGVEQHRSTSEIDTTLYRIAQEALNNIAKHAHAANVTVLLEHRAETVSLIIEDDGIGFDAENAAEANRKGLGLVGMRERAALVGGTVEIESRPGEGATVYIRIPAPLTSQKGEGS